MNTQVATQNTVTIESFEYSGAAFKPEKNGYRLYGPFGITENGGALITEGSFSKVQVWMEPTVVMNSQNAAGKIGLPGPNPVRTPSPEATYPNAPFNDLVIVQCEGDTPVHGSKVSATYTAMAITATSEADAQTIDLNPENKNLFIAFNDFPGAYGDNSGEVQVHVKLIK